MDLDAEVAVLEKSRRTLTRWGIWGTALYLGALLGYGVFAWRDFTTLSPNEVGDFLAGAFAPLAFLWLVIGYWMQSLELEHNSKEMRNAVEQATEQAKALKASESYSRQTVVNQTCKRFEGELAAFSAYVYLESFPTSRMDSVGLWWSQVSAGDVELFPRKFFGELYASNKYKAQFMYNGHQKSLVEIYIELIGENSHSWPYIKNYISCFDDLIDDLKQLGEGDLSTLFRSRDFGKMYDLLVDALKVHEAE